MTRVIQSEPNCPIEPRLNANVRGLTRVGLIVRGSFQRAANFSGRIVREHETVGSPVRHLSSQRVRDKTVLWPGPLVSERAQVDNTERSCGRGVAHQGLTVIAAEAVSRLGTQDKTS